MYGPVRYFVAIVLAVLLGSVMSHCGAAAFYCNAATFLSAAALTGFLPRPRQ